MRPLPRLRDQPLLQEARRWPGAAPSAPGASETPLRTHCRRTGQSASGAGPGLDQGPKLDSGCELMGGREKGWKGGQEGGRRKAVREAGAMETPPESWLEKPARHGGVGAQGGSQVCGWLLPSASVRSGKVGAPSCCPLVCHFPASRTGPAGFLWSLWKALPSLLPELLFPLSADLRPQPGAWPHF